MSSRDDEACLQCPKRPQRLTPLSAPVPVPPLVDFGGHDNHAHDNVYAYVGQGFGICGQLKGHVDYFVNNIVVQTNDGNYANGGCSGDGKTVVGNNTVYTPTGRVTECGMPLAAWQAQGNDPLTTNYSFTTLTDDFILSSARTVLGM